MRLKYVDMLRGFAVLLMLFTQIWDMFSRDFNMYSSHYVFVLKYFNWLSIFLVVSGFSLMLMFERYPRKEFLKKNSLRCSWFVIAGFLLSFWCGFPLSPFSEVVMSIGISAGLLGCIMFLFFNKKNSLFLVCLLLVLFFISNLTYSYKHPFNPVWLFNFMLFGMFLAITRKHMLIWCIIPFLSLIASVPQIDYYSRTVDFLFFNLFVVTALFIVMKGLENYDRFCKFLSFFGKNAFWLYILHFAVVQKGLVFFNTYKTFNLFESLVFTFIWIFYLCLVIIIKNIIKPKDL